MFADPQTVTVNAVAKVMPKIETKGTSATYSLADETFKLTVSHQKTNSRIRTMVRIDQRAVVPDPLTAVNDFETLSFYFVIDRPVIGFSSAQVEQLATGLKAWMDSTALGKLYGLES